MTVKAMMNFKLQEIAALAQWLIAKYNSKEISTSRLEVWFKRYSACLASMKPISNL
jgi:hypothetical protein